MTADERRQVCDMLVAHARTIDVCQACATTTRDLAAEVKRGGVPNGRDLQRTFEEAEAALVDLGGVRQEVVRLLTAFGGSTEPVA